MDEQMTITPEETVFERNALGVTVRFSLSKMSRRRCEGCGLRRVVYAVGITNVGHGPALCSKCAGIR